VRSARMAAMIVVCIKCSVARKQNRADAPGRRPKLSLDVRRFEVKRLVLIFSKEKETKGTYRYREAEVADRETAVGSLYVKKSVVGESPPGQFRVTIEAQPEKIA
jgi:hypothetical protein